MEIESLRLDFQTHIITKPQNNSRAYQRRKKIGRASCRERVFLSV